jgi:hypothetical protein
MFIASVLALCGSAIAANAPACPPVDSANSRPTFDASRLKEGRFTYRLTSDGKSLGDAVIEIRRDGKRYRITMGAPDVKQSWESTLTKSFEPLSAHLLIGRPKGAYEMTLRYAGKKITGKELDGATARDVSATAEGIVIDQRVDWAAIMATPAPAGSSIALQVFDPSTAFSRMVGKIGETQKMSGPGGVADVRRLDYSICKRDHVEQYTVFATRDPPHIMLREDMPNGLVSELIRSEP